MSESKPVDRRSFLRRVVGVSLLAGGAATLVTGRAYAQSGVSDSDPTDPIGRGRGPYTGVTDNDPTDFPSRGQVGGAAARPRRARGGPVTDGDYTEGWSDPGGRGRGPQRTTSTGVTDGDGSPAGYTDAAGFGRGRPGQ